MSGVSQRISIFTAILTCAACLFAEEPAGERAVSELVSQLGAASRAERESAERALIAMGPAVLAELPESSSDPATKYALTRIRERLSAQRARGDVTEATRVSIAGSGSLGDIAADWPDAAGTRRLALSPEQRQQRVTLDERNVPYWRAMDRIAEDAGLWPGDWNQNGALTFRERTAEDDERRLDYPGAFRVAGGPLTVKPIPGAEERRLYRVPLEIRAEPGVRPLFITHAAKSGELIAGDGIHLSAFTPGAKYDIPVGKAGGAARLRLDFAGPAIEGPTAFTGEFVATVASREAAFGFELPRGGFRPVEKQQGDVTVRLRNVGWNDDGNIRVGISVVYGDGGSAFESYRTWVYHNDAEIIIGEDQDTLRLPPEPAFDTVAQSPGALLLHYTFEGVPAVARNVRFEYRAPTDVIEVPFEVRLDGLAVEGE